MICKNCGKEVSSSMKFCTACGTPTSSTSPGSNPTQNTVPSHLRVQKGTQGKKYTSKRITPSQGLVPSPRKIVQTRELTSFSGSFYTMFLGLAVMSWNFELLFIPGIILIGLGIIFRKVEPLKIAYSNSGRPTSIWIMLIFPILALMIFRVLNIWQFFITCVIMAVAYVLTPPIELIAISETDEAYESKPRTFKQVSGVPTSPIEALTLFSILGAFVALGSTILGILIFSIGVADHVTKLNQSAIRLIRAPEEVIEVSSPLEKVSLATPVAATGSSLVAMELGTFPITNISSIKVNLTNLIEEIENENRRFRSSIDGILRFYNVNSAAIESRENYLKDKTSEHLKQDANTIQNMKKEMERFQRRVENVTNSVNYIKTVYIPFIKNEVISSLNPELRMLKVFLQTIQTVEQDLDNFELTSLLNRSNTISETSDKLIQGYITLTRKEKVTAARLEEEKFETQSFKLKSVVSERRLSNLFAYFGVLFIVSGIIYGLNYSYLHYILPEFPEDVESSRALQGVILIYTVGILLGFVTPAILNKFVKIPRWGFNLFYCVGFLTFQIGIFVQKFYFTKLETPDPLYIFWGILICSIIAGLSYFFKSNLLGLTLAEFGAWYIHELGVQDVGTDYMISIISLVVMGLLFISTTNRGLWMPFWGFGLLILPVWLDIQNTTGLVLLPELLALVLAISNVYLSLANKLKVEKTFGHFAVTIFLILPNVFSVNYAIVNMQDTLSDPFRQFMIIAVFSCFFILYWVFLFVEGELSVSVKIPVNYKFKEEQVRLKSINQRLNWMMLSSVAILIVASTYLADYETYRPVLYFALLMSVMAIVSIRKNFEKLVESSVFVIIIAAELFFIMSEFNVDIDTWTMIPYGAFLISFAFIFIELLKGVNNKYRLILAHQPVRTLVIIVGGINFYNFISASLSDFMLEVELFTVIIWIIVSQLVTRLKERKVSGDFVYQIPALIPPLTLLLIGILHLDSGLGETVQETTREHLLINLPLILLILYSYILVGGRRLEIPKSVTLSNQAQSRYLKSGRLYFPQIILLIIPMIIIIYGKPYFYVPINDQAILFAYILVYFVSLPILIIISSLRKNDNFSINSGLTCFYSILLSFVFLGGAAQVYARLTDSSRPFNRDWLLIPIEMATYLFVVIFIASVFSIMLLSRNTLEKNISPIETQPEVTS